MKKSESEFTEFEKKKNQVTIDISIALLLHIAIAFLRIGLTEACMVSRFVPE